MKNLILMTLIFWVPDYRKQCQALGSPFKVRMGTSFEYSKIMIKRETKIMGSSFVHLLTSIDGPGLVKGM